MLYSVIVIDWLSLLMNSFWIIGSAILLAALSYHYWLADQEGRRFRDQVEQPAFQRFFWLSFVFIGVGLAGTSQRVWETTIWIIFTLFSVVNTIRSVGK